ncbi:hypothetical protein FRY77_31170 [Halomonas sp. MG34]|nr:hypothetical protein [Halomonas sp. MG34]
MEEVKVLKAFRDKTDKPGKGKKKKVYRKGDTYQHEDADRIAFLVEKGYLEENKQPPKDTTEDNKQEVEKATSEPDTEKATEEPKSKAKKKAEKK